MKKIDLVIDKCTNCPYCRLEEGTHYCVEYKKPRSWWSIEDANKIQEYCPLKDF